VETLSSMIGDCLLAQELTGTRLLPDGNRHADMAPHSCYPCAGGGWISIAVDDETCWRRMCQELDATALVDDPRYATLTDRIEHSDALDVEIAMLTRSHDAEQLAQRLRAAGVPAAKSATVLDIIGDQLLWDRELFRFVSDHREGQRPVVAAPWRMSGVEAEIARGAPDLGEHDEYVRDVILHAHAMEGR
jgi:crotonobetainyl-CoA:carnitine CoA-transferase CaiB-like acyl-CoA transferase